MPKNLKCIECQSMNEKLYEDPRIPPLDIYDCLCTNCISAAIDERVEELQEEINELKEQQTIIDG